MFVSPISMGIFDQSLEAAKSRQDFEINAIVNVCLSGNVEEALLPMKYTLAMYIGGMGSKNENFHKNLIARMGYADEAEEIQDTYLKKGHEAAAKAVPFSLVDEISICGPIEKVKERLQVWKNLQLQRS